MTTRTVGEVVEERGFCEAMLKIAELAEALGRIPCGEWDYTFTTDPKWRICLNGGPHDEWTPPDGLETPRYHASVMCNGWPAGLINPAGGTMIGTTTEDDLIAALTRELHAVEG